MVAILTTYVSGTRRMLEVTLQALARHDAGHPYVTLIVTDCRDEAAFDEAASLSSDVVSYDVGPSTSGSGQHAKLLDRAVLDIHSEFFLTMDSDCFPVADGWLGELVRMSGEDVASAGIVWPWVPPPETVGQDTIEWRIRRYHCWENTQPACQLVRRGFFLDRGWKFADPDGDDTNHGFMVKAHGAGFRSVGWMPTRCPIPDGDFDPEMNRHESMIFGDMVYHHVGATRECRDGPVLKSEVFSKARDRVYNEKGAEWLLDPGNSYAYRKDREEEVAQFKMRMMYQTAAAYLAEHENLFSTAWAV